MKKLSILLFVSIFILQSCGEDKKPVEKTEKRQLTLNDNTANLSNDLELTINADFNTNDEIVVFWKDKSIGWFDDKNVIYAGAADIDGHQSVEVKFPQGIIPNDLRIDISSNDKQESIKINFIKIKSGPREFYMFGDEIDKYFKPNDFISYDKSSRKLTFKKVNDDYDPFLNTTHDFILELEKVLNTQF
ncbi:hypothetical protein [Faecalibacter rhinopitheci]|uniref:Lipoprotein n=1 Tax=Faecalibacter rhinopitheci TaxID=2779678 RepID=A0A8J7FS56_9FLAO|nr:hypothetical protein [Faecalibacter rhinopitheci]MBF0597703.1 hypothetical protein [Faecalibacter rhinopitheci]